MRSAVLTMVLGLLAASLARADGAMLPYAPSRETVERVVSGGEHSARLQLAQARQPVQKPPRKTQQPVAPAPAKKPGAPAPAVNKPGTPGTAGKPTVPASTPKVQTQTGKKPPVKVATRPPVPPVDPDAVKRGPFIEPRPGFFLGKGTLRGFRGELAGGFYPGWLDGAFAFVFQAGYYGASAKQKQNDPDLGVVTRSWQMTAIPVGATARWFLTSGAVQPYVVGGVDYTRVSFRYDAKIAAGPLQEPRETGLNAAGPRGGAGLALNLGPGVLDAELAITHAFLPSDPQGTPGRIYAPVMFAGYGYVF